MPFYDRYSMVDKIAYLDKVISRPFRDSIEKEIIFGDRVERPHWSKLMFIYW